ncbi:MAG: cation transporter [Fibrobacterota bacterium]
MKSIELTIQGMNCGHCVKAVQGAIASVAGATATEVKVGSAKVDLDESITGFEQIAKAVEEEGFKVVRP